MKSLAALLAGAALAAGANAGTMSFSDTNALETTEINQILNLGLFDSTLGVLTGVSLTFGGASETTFTLVNLAAQTQNVEAVGTTKLNFSSTLGALDAVIATNNPVITITSSTGVVAVPNGGGSVSVGPVANSDTIVWTEANFLSGLLGSFSAVGGGALDLGCGSISSLVVLGGGGNLLAGQATKAGCSASIVYTYRDQPTNVPEPGALALVGIALAGLSLTRRKAAKA